MNLDFPDRLCAEAGALRVLALPGLAVPNTAFRDPPAAAGVDQWPLPEPKAAPPRYMGGNFDTLSLASTTDEVKAELACTKRVTDRAVASQARPHLPSLPVCSVQEQAPKPTRASKLGV